MYIYIFIFAVGGVSISTSQKTLISYRSFSTQIRSFGNKKFSNWHLYHLTVDVVWALQLVLAPFFPPWPAVKAGNLHIEVMGKPIWGMDILGWNFGWYLVYIISYIYISEDPWEWYIYWDIWYTQMISVVLWMLCNFDVVCSLNPLL